MLCLMVKLMTDKDTSVPTVMSTKVSKMIKGHNKSSTWILVILTTWQDFSNTCPASRTRPPEPKPKRSKVNHPIVIVHRKASHHLGLAAESYPVTSDPRTKPWRPEEPEMTIEIMNWSLILINIYAT